MPPWSPAIDESRTEHVRFRSRKERRVWSWVMKERRAGIASQHECEREQITGTPALQCYLHRCQRPHRCIIQGSAAHQLLCLVPQTRTLGSKHRHLGVVEHLRKPREEEGLLQMMEWLDSRREVPSHTHLHLEQKCMHLCFTFTHTGTYTHLPVLLIKKGHCASVLRLQHLWAAPSCRTRSMITDLQNLASRP